MRDPGGGGSCAAEGHPSLPEAGGEGLINTCVSCHSTGQTPPCSGNTRQDLCLEALSKGPGDMTTRVNPKMAAGNMAPSRGSFNTERYLGDRGSYLCYAEDTGAQKGPEVSQSVRPYLP